MLSFIGAELFELYWQKSPTLLRMLERIYVYYRQSPFLLYVMHPSYVMSLGLFYTTHYNLWVLLIIAIKSVDILFKVMLVRQHFEQDALSDEMMQVLNAPLHPILFFMGLSLYPYLLFLALY